SETSRNENCLKLMESVPPEPFYRPSPRFNRHLPITGPSPSNPRQFYLQKLISRRRSQTVSRSPSYSGTRSTSAAPQQPSQQQPFRERRQKVKTKQIRHVSRALVVTLWIAASISGKISGR